MALKCSEVSMKLKKGSYWLSSNKADIELNRSITRVELHIRNVLMARRCARNRVGQ